MIFKKKNKTISKEILRDLFNQRIYFGPFSGLKIPENLYNTLSLPEILGFYESCLHPIFSDLINRNIKNIILVGGNNGYYAAGISQIFNPKIFYVYEMQKTMHKMIESWFDINNLSKPIIMGEATEQNFSDLEEKIDFMLIDCEGAEEILLNPEINLWQKNTDILAELHPFYVENLISKIINRFKHSHEINLIYDDFSEDEKINKVLEGLNLNIKYPKHPTHRWIIEDNKKVYTSGLFVYLKSKKI